MIAAPLVFVVMLFQALDAWTTYKIISAGGRELNGILAKLFQVVGLKFGLAISKGGFAVLVLVLHFYGAWNGHGLLILSAISLWYGWIVMHNFREMGR